MMDLLDEMLTLEEMEKIEISRRLDQNSNKTEVAKSLGISLKTLYNKLKRYNLELDFVKSKAKL